MTRRVWGAAPIRVYKSDGTWQWHCHLHGCTVSGWSGKQADSLALGETHLRRHNVFGFRSGR